MHINAFERLYTIEDWIITNELFSRIFYWYSRKTIEKYKNMLLKKWKLIKIAPKIYALWVNWKNYDVKWLSLMIDKNSYISLFNWLNHWVIKQWYLSLFCCTSKKKTKTIRTDYLWSYKQIEYHYINIPQNFWIHTDDQWIRYADQERSFLDMIYLWIQWTIKIPTELNVNVLDKEKIKQYLQYYPKRVKDFLDTKLINYVKK